MLLEAQMEEREKKKIDFKQKAINAKEASRKKTLAKHTKMANAGKNGGGSGKGPNAGKKSQHADAFIKCVKTI